MGMTCMYPGLLDSADIEEGDGDGPRLCDLKGNRTFKNGMMFNSRDLCRRMH